MSKNNVQGEAPLPPVIVPPPAASTVLHATTRGIPDGTGALWEEAAANSNLVPLAIYDVMARGFEKPELPMVGFTMYELSAGVGLIRRLMIDQRFQGKGYGRVYLWHP